jgi:WD40 repeat protein
LRENTLATTGEEPLFYRMVFSPDGKLFAGAATKGMVRLWEVPSGKELMAPDLGPHEQYSLAFSADSKTLVGCGYQEAVNADSFGHSEIVVWEVPSSKKRLSLKGAAESLAVSSDGKTIASGWGNSITFWDLSNGQDLATLAAPADCSSVISFSPDAKTLATGGYTGAIMLWNVATRRLRATLKGHTGIISGLAFSADGTAIASCGYDGTIRVWGGKR